jgi:hypothetical protein
MKSVKKTKKLFEALCKDKKICPLGQEQKSDEHRSTKPRMKLQYKNQNPYIINIQ